MICNAFAQGNLVVPTSLKLVSVALSGTEGVGSTLTANPVVKPSSALNKVSYQWYRGNTPINEATSKTYTLVDDDRANTIKVRATLRSKALFSVPTGAIYGWKSVVGDLYNMTSDTTPFPFTVLSGNYRSFRTPFDMSAYSGEPYGNMTYESVLDLGSNYKINKLDLKFLNKYNAYTRKATSKVTVSGSLNNSSWTTIIDQKDMSTTDHTGTTGDFPNEATVDVTEGEYRYIKISTRVTSATYSTRWRSIVKVSGYKEWSNT